MRVSWRKDGAAHLTLTPARTGAYGERDFRGEPMLGRRALMKITLGSVAMAPVFVRRALAQTFKPEDAAKQLFPAPGLPGGGQMEVRMVAEAEHPDPDVVEVAHRLKPFNPESWYAEHLRMAEKNEAQAAGFEREQRAVTASEYYLRAAGFYRSAVVYLADTDPRMLPAYNKLRATFDKAWTLVPPPFQKVEIPFAGTTLEGHFYAARVPQGRRPPVVFNYGGADGILLSGQGDGGSGQYRARGISYFNVDGPGHGGSLRVKKLYATPDAERYVRTVVDYLVTRPDVDPDRIAIHGSSMGGYSAPRAASVEKRLKACAVWSGSYNVREDLFDYYPPIQDRVRWLTGSKTLAEARDRIGQFTLEGRAKQIECPLLVGYSIDDRVMDPRGALKLYENAVNAKREMIEGTGHGRRKFELRTYIADWFAKQLGTAGT